MGRARLAAIDGLRACAVVAVVLFHVELAPNGFLGVDVFFVLSGFLITGLVMGEWSRTGGVRLARFYLRRALRLYPALVAVVAFCVLAAVVGRRQLATVVHDAIVSLLYVSNISYPQAGVLDHTWTLALEEQFYLVWPALLAISLVWRRHGHAWWWVPACLLVATVLCIDLLTGRDGISHTYVRSMGLPLGAALALATDRGRRIPDGLVRAGLVTGPVLVIVAFLRLPHAITTGWPVSIGALLALPVVASLVGRESRLLASAPMVWLGRRSYSLYLWHFPVLALASSQAPSAIPHWLPLSLGVIASVVLAHLSYGYIEQPVLRWRDRRAASDVAVASTGTAQERYRAS